MKDGSFAAMGKEADAVRLRGEFENLIKKLT